MDDGLLYRLGPEHWRSRSGAPWPFQNELVTGCTLEHGGYWLSWLVVLFGPAVEVSSFATNLVEDPVPGGSTQPDALAPDFSVACIRFQSGVVARLTCSIVASRNREMKIFGDSAEVTVSDAWDFGARLKFRMRPEMEEDNTKVFPLPLLRKPPEKPPEMLNNIDFCRGITELSEAIAEDRSCRLSAELAVHLDEITHLISESGAESSTRKLTTTFEPIDPMDWAS